jgi:hypothetical protein
MQNLWVLHSLCDFPQHDEMAYIVEVALKININHLGQPLHQPVHHSIQRPVRCAPWPICKRAVVKISFKDRFQDEL